jgi:hypothetical protein
MRWAAGARRAYCSPPPCPLCHRRRGHSRSLSQQPRSIHPWQSSSRLHTTVTFVTEAVAVPLPFLTEQTWLAGCVATVTSYGEFGCNVTSKREGTIAREREVVATVVLQDDRSGKTRDAAADRIGQRSGNEQWLEFALLPPHPDSTVASPMTGSESRWRIAKPVKSVWRQIRLQANRQGLLSARLGRPQSVNGYDYVGI